MGNMIANISEPTKGKLSGCNGLCSYKYNYSETPEVTSWRQKGAVGISIKGEDEVYIKTNNKNNKYTLTGVTFLSPSWHLYDGEQVDLELVISHESFETKKKANIYIPVKTVGNEISNPSTIFFDKIIPNLGHEKAKKNIGTGKEFSLNNIVPEGDFYYYNFNKEGTLDCIVFGKEKSISINKRNMDIINRSFKFINGNTFIKYKNELVEDIRAKNESGDNQRLYKNGTGKEGFGTVLKEGFGLGAVGPDKKDENITFKECQYAGEVNKEKEKGKNNKDGEKLYSWGMSMFVMLLIIVIIILVMGAIKDSKKGDLSSSVATEFAENSIN